MFGENAFFLTTRNGDDEGTGGKGAYAKAAWFFGWTFAGSRRRLDGVSRCMSLKLDL